MSKKDLYRFRIITAKGEKINEEVSFVKMPAIDEALGVLQSHSPTLVELDIGKLRITKADGQKEYFFVPGGIAQVMPDEVVILTEFIEHADEINIKQAQEDEKAAKAALESNDDRINRHRETEKLKRSAARMFVHSLQFGQGSH
jgi:F-type H+-transporting ATPase subunit epsilon